LTELAALNIKITGDETDLSAALASARGDLGQFDGAVNRTQGAMRQIPRAAGGMAQSLRGVSQQLSQVGQQTMATGNFIQALAIQLPDIGIGFGAIGGAAGLLAGIALPLLINAFSGASEASEIAAQKAERLKEAYDALGTSVADNQSKIDQLRFGVDEEYQVQLLQEQIRLRAEYNAKVGELNNYLATTTDSLDRQQITTKDLLASIQDTADAYNSGVRALREQEDRSTTLAVLEGVKAQRAGEVAAKQRETAAAADRTKTVYTALANSAKLLSGHTGDAKAAAVLLAGVSFGNIATAAGWAANLAGSLRAAAQVHSNMMTQGQTTGSTTWFWGQTAEDLLPPKPGLAPGVPGGGGGGGGGGGRDWAEELAAFEEQLMTEAELEQAQFDLRQTALEEFLAQRVITQEEYQAYMEQIKSDHEGRMGQIEADAYAARLSQTADLFGALASIASVGGQKMAKAVAIAQGIEGTINAYGAAIKALNTPGLTLAGRFAAYASVLAAGLKGVAAIRGSGGGGAGGGAAGVGAAASAGAAQGPLQVNLNTYGFGDFISRADFGSMLDKLGEVAGDRGYRIMVPA
jgi:hypothetical protein